MRYKETLHSLPACLCAVKYYVESGQHLESTQPDPLSSSVRTVAYQCIRVQISLAIPQKANKSLYPKLYFIRSQLKFEVASQSSRKFGFAKPSSATTECFLSND